MKKDTKRVQSGPAKGLPEPSEAAWDALSPTKKETATKILVPADLNDEQREAYIKMVRFIEGNEDGMFLLRGFAGCGKTYTVNKLISYILNGQGGCIAMTAPTNKAVKVLQKMNTIKDSNLAFQTVHKLLGLKEEITREGKQIFTRKKEEDCTIQDFDVVVVDEVSMIPNDIFHELRRHSGSVKIIFTGDPAQIPPVGEDDCIPFLPDECSKYRIEEFSLTRIMRQAKDNPIIATSFVVRNDLRGWAHDIPRESKLMESGNGVVFVDAGKDRPKLTEYFKEYFDCQAFKDDADWAKIIAWRNVTVDSLNNIIRTMIYKTEAMTKIMPGEKLLANKPIMSDFKTVLFNTNDEFDVEDFTVETRTVATSEKSVRLKFYRTDVNYILLNGKSIRRSVDILHEDSERDFNAAANALKQEAIQKKGAGRSWMKYYDFLRLFADINYNYAVTCHKSQGSTYNNTFVIVDDIEYNRNLYERNRILYTAFTRASERLFIVKK